MAREKPKFVFTIHFFTDSPSLSWNLQLVQGKKTLQTLADGKVSWDGTIVKLAQEWEAAGAEVVASRYKEGKWSEYKHWLWFKRFQKAVKI